MRRSLAAAAVLLATVSAAWAANATDESPSHSREWGPTHPQPGYVQFCEDYYDGRCGPYAPGGERLVLTDEKRALLAEVNATVNRYVTPITDMEMWGVEDHWSYPVQRDGGMYGDCETYVLLKRRLLMETGWPAHALLITVVFDRVEGGHAVLTVATDEGDLILDNLSSEIRLWHETPYRFVKRQSERNPNQWVSLRPRANEPDVPVAGNE